MGGPFEGKPGPLIFQKHTNWSISDDTQLTLATCESIVLTQSISPEHIANRFLQWYRDRRITGIGASSLAALRALEAGLHWALAGAKGEMSAGNGAAMRIAPLAFHLDPSAHEDRQLIRDVCRITHQNEEAYAGALAIVAAIRSLAFHDAAPDQLLENVLMRLPDSRVRDRILKMAQLPPNQSLNTIASQFGNSGYVVDSVPLALFAARSIDQLPLETLLQNVIEAGGDTDTIASMTGQIAGASLGATKIPDELLRSLPNLREIETIAAEFSETIKESP